MSAIVGNGLAIFAPCIAFVAGCYSAATRADADLMLRVRDGTVWVTSEDMPRYRCVDGVFVCTNDGGRLTLQRCRCL
jgi:hypothetical protein